MLSMETLKLHKNLLNKLFFFPHELERARKYRVYGTYGLLFILGNTSFYLLGNLAQKLGVHLW